MKKLLITGSFGLVGTEICAQLARNYPDIEVTKVKLDEGIYSPEQFDYIIHAAGYGQPLKFLKDKIITIRINSCYTEFLFKFLKKDGKFLFVSSSEVYSGTKSPYKETDIGTTTPQHPRACYIEGKRCGEAICMAYREQGFDVKIARLGLGYGPGTKKGDTRALHFFIEQALKHDIVLQDDGSAKRTYCYISDAAEMLLNILFKGTQPVYNVGGKSETTIRDLAMMIARKLGRGIRITDGVKDGHFLKGAPDEVQLDISRYENEFGKKEFIELSEGLDKTIEWQKKSL